MGVSRAMSWLVRVRDNFTCQYCGSKAPDVKLEIDHLFPKSKGGKDEITNLVTSCYDCNHGKMTKVLPPHLMERYREIASRAVEAPRKQTPRRRAEIYLRKQLKIPARKRKEVFGDGRFSVATNYGNVARFESIPVTDRFVYVAPDEFATEFACRYCGMVNSYEGDQCSCRRRAENNWESEDYKTCALCDERVSDSEYEDYGRLCEVCSDDNPCTACGGRVTMDDLDNSALADEPVICEECWYAKDEAEEIAKVFIPSQLTLDEALHDMKWAEVLEVWK